jgi:hypothetical protein
MFEQTPPGWQQGTPARNYLIAAVLEFIVEIGIGVVSNAARLPKATFAVPVIVLIAFAAKMLLEYINGREWPRGGSSRSAIPASADVLWGRRGIRSGSKAIIGSLLLVGAVLIFFVSLNFFASYEETYEYSYSFGQGSDQVALLLIAISASIAVTLTVLGLFMIIGARPYLALSERDIRIRNNCGMRLIVPWEYVTEMRVVNSAGRDWLVAGFRPSFRPFRLQLAMAEDGMYRLCNLTACGFDGRSVAHGVNYWHQLRQSKNL